MVISSNGVNAKFCLPPRSPHFSSMRVEIDNATREYVKKTAKAVIYETKLTNYVRNETIKKLQHFANTIHVAK